MANVRWDVGAPAIYVALMLNLENSAWGTGRALPLTRINPLQSSLYAMELREALQNAIPKGFLAKVCFSGMAEPASAPVTPLQANFSGIVLPSPAKHNWTRAQSLLRNLGYNVTVSPIALAVGPSYIYQGSSVKAYGYFLYNGTPISGSTITIVAGPPYRTVSQVVTTREGTFNFTLYPPSGSYYFKAEYPGGLTPLGLLPPVQSPVVGPIQVVNWWAQNWIYVAVIVVFAALLVVLAIRRFFGHAWKD